MSRSTSGFAACAVGLSLSLLMTVSSSGRAEMHLAMEAGAAFTEGSRSGQLGARLSFGPPDRFGGFASLSLMPHYFDDDGIAGLLDGGVVRPISLSRAFSLEPQAGASVLGVWAGLGGIARLAPGARSQRPTRRFVSPAASASPIAVSSRGRRRMTSRASPGACRSPSGILSRRTIRRPTDFMPRTVAVTVIVLAFAFAGIPRGRRPSRDAVRMATQRALQKLALRMGHER